MEKQACATMMKMAGHYFMQGPIVPFICIKCLSDSFANSTLCGIQTFANFLLTMDWMWTRLDRASSDSRQGTCTDQYMAIRDLLADRFATYSLTPLCLATRESLVESTKLLLDAGADPTYHGGKNNQITPVKLVADVATRQVRSTKYSQMPFLGMLQVLRHIIDAFIAAGRTYTLLTSSWNVCTAS
jgi:hypothetical protein